jgi:hypothetical protein
MTECDEIAETMTAPRWATFAECRAIVKAAGLDTNSETVIDNIATEVCRLANIPCTLREIAPRGNVHLLAEGPGGRYHLGSVWNLTIAVEMLLTHQKDFRKRAPKIIVTAYLHQSTDSTLIDGDGRALYALLDYRS